MRKYISMLVTMALVLTMLPAMVAAETTDPLWDVEKGKWYYKDIHEVFARDLIRGQEELGKVSFKPDNQVSQTEALIMVLRYLDLEGNVDNLSASDADSRLGLIGVDPAQVPSWAKSHIAYSISLGYVKSRNDAMTIPASRAWIAQLLVRVLEKESQALSADMMKDTNFADDRSIQSNLKGYVNTVVSLGLIKGVSENGVLKFNPGGTTTRAEMATILKRLDEHRTVPSNYSKEVVIKELTETGIEFQNADGRYEHLEMNNPTVFLYGEKRTLRDLNKYDKARIAVRSNKIVFVDVTGKGELKDNVIFGTLEKINNADDDKFIVINVDNELVTWKYLDTLVIKDSNGSLLNIDSLKQGQELQMFMDNENNVKELIVKLTISTPQIPENNIVGTISDIDTEKDLITLLLDNGSYVTKRYDENTFVTLLNSRFPQISDLVKGDRVKLIVKETIVEIEVLELAKEKQAISASFVEANVADAYITYRVDGKLNISEVSPRVTILVPGLPNPKLSDLKKGDQMNLEIIDGAVTKIVVGERIYLSELTGRFLGVNLNSSPKLINYRAENGLPMVKELDDDVVVEIEGKLSTLSNLTQDMRILLTVDNDLVTKITFDNIKFGKIKSVDAVTNRVIVTSSEGIDTTFKFTSSVEVDIFNLYNEKGKISDLKTGQEIQFYLTNNDEIKHVKVIYTDQFVVTNTSTLAKYIVIIKNGIVGGHFFTDQTELNVEGVENPVWEDIKGKTATITFLGKEIIKVEVKK